MSTLFMAREPPMGSYASSGLGRAKKSGEEVEEYPFPGPYEEKVNNPAVITRLSRVMAMSVGGLHRIYSNTRAM
jgi:hypothetical protein